MNKEIIENNKLIAELMDIRVYEYVITKVPLTGIKQKVFEIKKR